MVHMSHKYLLKGLPPLERATSSSSSSRSSMKEEKHPLNRTTVEEDEDYNFEIHGDGDSNDVRIRNIRKTASTHNF
jgi:hypothetical protein